MEYIFLSILSASGIFAMFKLTDKKNLPTPSVITINYLVAYLIGFALYPENPLNAVSQAWFTMAFSIGFLFIVFFFVIGLSSKYAGMSITSVAGKMSVIIPIAFSILYYKEALTSLKIAGMALALVSLFLTVYKSESKHSDAGLKRILLPILLFFGTGCIDSFIKYTQGSIGIENESQSFFTSVLFLISFLFGLIYTMSSSKLRKNYRNLWVYIYGIVLGLFNYGSIYFLISALNSSQLDSSVIFGINNVGIVVFSVLLGIIIFKEKIEKLNYIGIIGSVVAIWILSISQINH